eukprot:TRINITY_DN2180_c0_g2_i3.p1 TRINITY_DN2180_c0_g2~~TRINITY_DN2180_c0_g2_i3.p1  ORF type:complete len:107 (-),score=11.79 TRINITY_DN2180_c0_g2_i3:46-366(-)
MFKSIFLSKFNHHCWGFHSSHSIHHVIDDKNSNFHKEYCFQLWKTILWFDVVHPMHLNHERKNQKKKKEPRSLQSHVHELILTPHKREKEKTTKTTRAAISAQNRL